MVVSKRNKTRLQWAVCLGVVAGANIAPGAALAEEWTANYTSLVAATYNDNPTLAVENASSRIDFTVNRAIDAEYAKDRYRIDIVGRANLVASKDEIANSVFAADQIRYNLDVGGEYDLEASVLMAGFGLGFDTVQNTEFDDAGTLTSDVTRTDARLNLGYTRELNERWGLNVSDTYSLATYSGGTFTEYSNNTFLLGFSNTYSERLVITPGVGYTRYKPDSETLSPSNTYRMQVASQYQLSETDSLNITLGGVQTDGNLGWSALVGYNQEVMDGLVVTANVNRDNIPSSTGVVRQSTGFGGGVNYQLLEMMRVGMTASWRKSGQVSAASSGDTTQLTLNPSVNWTLNEKWGAGINLQNRRQKLATSGTATSSSVTFALNYNLPIE